MPSSTPLGDFLRARRDAASPESLPFPVSGRRRVPGLRRDEVALQAGVSVDYYTRLEQGRETNPSPQVVDALARALELTTGQAEHLYRLADLRWDPPAGPSPVRPDDELVAMMDTWPRSAAFVIDPLLDIVATNSVADALFEPFVETVNLAEMLFLDPAGRTFYADWKRAAESCAASLRATSHHSSRPDRETELMDRLLAEPDFADLWARYDVATKSREQKVLVHPVAGEITVSFHTFHVAQQPGHELVVYQAEPGSLSEQRLLALTTTDATMEAPTAAEATLDPA